MDQEFNLISAIRTILKWKTPIITLTLLSGVIAALFSVFVMDEYYLSWSTFYPTNQSLTDRSAIFSTENAQLEYFGTKADVNRILTIANSTPVIDFVIDSFKIAQHYKIDTTTAYWRTKVRKKFEKNYSAIKTDKDAVEISLYDTDPKLAADLINTVVNQVDDLNKLHVNDIKRKTFSAISDQIAQYQTVVSSYIDTLADLGEKYKIKASVGTDGTLIVEGNDYKAVQLYKTFMSKQNNATRELNNLMNIKGQMAVSLRNAESSLFILEQAFPADRRTKPVRSLVVLVTVLITAFVSVIGVLLMEEVKEIKKQL